MAEPVLIILNTKYAAVNGGVVGRIFSVVTADRLDDWKGSVL